MSFPKMTEIVRPGERGSAKVDIVEMSDSESSMTRLFALKARNPEIFVPPGSYARLLINGEIMMSDTPMERRSNALLMRGAEGRVLVGGLGLGMLAHGLAAIAEVEQIDVVERNPDVIALVKDTLPPKVRVVEGDVFLWRPTGGYDHMIFDIWPDICEDNLREMTKLKRRYRHWASTPATKILCWSENLIKARRRL